MAAGSSPKSRCASPSWSLQLPRFALPSVRSSANSAKAASHSDTKSDGCRHAFDSSPPRVTDHLVYDTRQDCRRMFPADDIEALKGLVGEIQCVTDISEVAISHSDEH